MPQPTSDRLPILLWGDIVRDSQPVLRRAVAGENAHECMYAWVYLTELLALKRLLEKMESPADFIELDEWPNLDRTAVDPHCQTVKASFDAVATAMCLTPEGQSPTFVELGSTFFASLIREKIIAKAMSDPPNVAGWIGIDNAQFMHDVTQLIHDQPAKLLHDYRDYQAADGFSVLLSRFVASYVFNSAAATAEFFSEFDAVVIEDAYSVTVEDVAVHNHGQPETFSSLPLLMKALEEQGYAIRVFESYPDFPSGAQQCHVVKYVAAKESMLGGEFFGRMNQLGIKLEEIQPWATSESLLDHLNEQVSAEDWERVKRRKQAYPVWGRTDTSVDYLAERPAFPKAGFGDYILSGPQAEDEIRRVAPR